MQLFLGLVASAAVLIFGVSAHTVTHVKVETHTLTVHHPLVATARPFGEHSSKHFEDRHHRGGTKKSKSREKKSARKGYESRSHDEKFAVRSGESAKKHVTKTRTNHAESPTSKPAKSHKGHSHEAHHSLVHTKGGSASTATKAKHETVKPRSSDKKRPHKTSHTVATTHASKPALAKPVLAVQTPDALSQLAQDSLQAHNDLRSKHKAKPLTWSSELASAAQDWSDKCIFQHGKGQAIGAGENLSAYTGSDDVLSAIRMWTDEASSYNWSAPGYSDSTAHFTQQVWASTSEIGCAQTLCPTLTIPDRPSWTNAYLYVCEYKQAGNVVGMTPEDTAKFFAENVLH